MKPVESSSSSSMAAPLVSFGLLTDVQYADVADGWNYHGTSQRYYRNALQQLHDVVRAWTDRDAPSLAFAVNLGDLIDGKNKPAGTSQVALDRAIAAWQPFIDCVGPVHHLVGNHELYNFAPHDLHKQLLWWPSSTTRTADAASTDSSAATATAAYYDFTVAQAPGVRFVVLNCYGVSSLGRPADDPVAIEARRTLRAVNRNANLNSPIGLAGLDARFVEFNGAVDAPQLAWLTETLAHAAAANEHVVLFTHIPIHPATAWPSNLLWNFAAVLHAVDTTNCVRVVFSGHTHADGYVYDRGVHYVVCDALLECAPHETAHAVVHVYADRLEVVGVGKIPTRVLAFPSAVESSE